MPTDATGRVTLAVPAADRENLRARVLAAAAELGYVSNPNAQAMARGRSNMLGLIIHDIADPYFSTVAAGVIREAHPANLLVSLASTQRDPVQELAHVAAFRRHRAAGVIIVGSRTSERGIADRLALELAAFEAEGGRAVAASQPRLPIDTVAIDNVGGSRSLATTLADLGYREFVVLGGPPNLLTATDRTTGFREGLAERGLRLRAQDVIAGDFTRNGGYTAMARLLETGRRQTASSQSTTSWRSAR